MASSSSGGGGGSTPQYFSLRWNNHPANLVSVFSGLFSSETLVDVTLAAEGRHIQCHKMLLSACSDYFQSLFSVNPCQHPIVILKDVHFDDLQTVVQFMYNGVVNVSSDKLPAVLKTADTLQIKGLGEKFSESVNQMMAGGVSASAVAGGGSSSFSSSGGHSSTGPRLLSVPSQHSVNSRQLSTESLPEYLHRTRDFSPRQASTDSRQYSIESTVSAALARKQPTPPASPPRHYRKKFRRMSGGGSSSERGNSLEDPERSPAPPPASSSISRSSPPAIHLSPSRQSSSSTDHGGDNAATGGGGASGASSTTGLTVAKKKRELFSARSSRSGGSNKSSASDYSREHSFKQLESSGSSGQSHSISQSQSQDDPASSMTLTVPGSGRTLSRAQSAGESSSAAAAAASSAAAETSSAPPSSPQPPPPKRNRFLKRQDCLEKGMDLTTDGLAEPPDIGLTPAATVKSSPNSPLMSACYPGLGSPQHDPPKPDQQPIALPPSSPVPPPPQAILSSSPVPPPSGKKPGGSGLPESLSVPPRHPHSPSSSPYYSLDAATSAHPAPLASPAPPQTSAVPAVPPSLLTHHAGPPPPQPHHLLPPPPISHHKLPSVRVIPDASLDPLDTDQQRMPMPNTRLLYPPEFERRGTLMKSRSQDSSSPATSFARGPGSSNPPSTSAHYEHHQSALPLNYHHHQAGGLITTTNAAPGVPLAGVMAGDHPGMQHHSTSISAIAIPTAVPVPPASAGHPPAVTSAPSSSSSSSVTSGLLSLSSALQQHQPTDQFGHCPKAREGPALGCNYCWNTTDSNGRILRRKTKYHCPECQANLCIVPCFQQYHEALERDKANSSPR